MFLRRHLFVQDTGSQWMIGESRDVFYVQQEESGAALLQALTHDGAAPSDYSEHPLFKELLKRGWLTEQRQPINRSTSFFESLGVSFDSALLASPLLILGAGAAGGTLAYMLAQLGFSRLCLVDPDVVEESDVQKTLVYRRSDLNRLKVEALRDSIETNFATKVCIEPLILTTAEDITKLLERFPASLIVNAIDPHPVFKLQLNRSSKLYNIPFITLAYSYERLVCGPLIIPGQTACYESVRSLLRQDSEGIYDIAQLKRCFTDYLIHPSITFVVSMLAGLMTKEIALFLAGRADLCLTRNHLLTYSILDMEGSLVELTCAPDCQICHASLASQP